VIALVVALVMVFMVPVAIAHDAGGHDSDMACFGMRRAHGAKALHPYGFEISKDARNYGGLGGLAGIHNNCHDL
jgi:hypothetical protein